MSRFFRDLRPYLLVFLFGSAPQARGDSPIDLPALAAQPGWLRIVHYEVDSRSPTGWRSAIHGGDFFLDAVGKDDPLVELRATLAAFATPLGGDPDMHARCRFPARWQFLKARIGDHPAFLPAIKCPAFDAWTRSGSVSSLSIVFATGYLGNPASFYGHTLLKFNFSGAQGQTRLMDVSVNYGAIVGKDDNPFTYITKSLTGGYDGGFSHINFYFHNHNYGDNELRDLWEYKLDLPQDAVDLVVAHAWEVLGKRYTYHFFRQNCAYRMAELLEIVDGLKVIPENRPWLIPQAMIENLAVANYERAPVLADVTYLPSRQSRFYEKYLSLSRRETGLLRDVVGKQRSLQDQAIQDLPTASRQALLDALLDYYQFVGNPLEKASKEIRQDYVDALSARYQLEAGLPETRSQMPVSPHLARPPGWLQTGWVHNSVTGDAISIRFRPAYYDVLDSDSGHVRNAALTMGDTRIEIRGNLTHIRNFDLLGVESAKPGLSELPGDNGLAWKVHTGAQQQRLSCDDCLVGRFQGDIGYGRQWSGRLFSAAYVGGALQNDRNHQGFGYAKTSADLILRPNARFGFRLGFEYRLPAGSRMGNYGVTTVEARWSLTPRADFRIDYERDGAEQLRAGIGFYW